jgi:hypothetical protein
MYREAPSGGQNFQAHRHGHYQVDQRRYGRNAGLPWHFAAFGASMFALGAGLTALAVLLLAGPRFVANEVEVAVVKSESKQHQQIAELRAGVKSAQQDGKIAVSTVDKFIAEQEVSRERR